MGNEAGQFQGEGKQSPFEGRGFENFQFWVWRTLWHFSAGEHFSLCSAPFLGFPGLVTEISWSCNGGGGEPQGTPQAGWGFLLAQPLHLSQPGWGDSHSWGRKQSSDPFLSRPLIITSCKDLLFHTTKWVNSIYGVFPVSECWWDQVTGGNLNGSLLSEACLIQTCPATQRYEMLKDHMGKAGTEKTLLR